MKNLEKKTAKLDCGYATITQKGCRSKRKQEVDTLLLMMCDSEGIYRTDDDPDTIWKLMHAVYIIEDKTLSPHEKYIAIPFKEFEQKGRKEEIEIKEGMKTYFFDSNASF